MHTVYMLVIWNHRHEREEIHGGIPAAIFDEVAERCQPDDHMPDTLRAPNDDGAFNKLIGASTTRHTDTLFDADAKPVLWGMLSSYTEYSVYAQDADTTGELTPPTAPPTTSAKCTRISRVMFSTSRTRPQFVYPSGSRQWGSLLLSQRRHTMYPITSDHIEPLVRAIALQMVARFFSQLSWATDDDTTDFQPHTDKLTDEITRLISLDYAGLTTVAEADAKVQEIYNASRKQLINLLNLEARTVEFGPGDVQPTTDQRLGQNEAWDAWIDDMMDDNTWGDAADPRYHI